MDAKSKTTGYVLEKIGFYDPLKDKNNEHRMQMDLLKYEK
jgi:ribosomal protein S16